MGSLGPMADNQFKDNVESATTAAAVKHLEDEGWAVIPDVLSPEETVRVRDELWGAADEAVARGEAHKAFLDPNDANIRVYYLLEQGKTFRDLVEHPLALELLRRYFGDKWVVSNFTANIARPGSKSMGLHSDQSLVVPEPWLEDWALNIIWVLDDLYRENGATLYIPGSNKWQKKQDIPKNCRSLLTPFEAKAGSILLMSGRVWHTSGNNITKDVDRPLMFAYYTRSFLAPQINWTMKLSEKLKDELSQETKNRLGIRIRANDLSDGIKHLDDEYPNE